MPSPKFYNANGDLTRYALSCGYVQGRKNVQLYMEHQCFHIVASTDKLKNEFVRVSTNNLSLARKAFRALVAGKKVEKSPEVDIYERKAER